MHGDEEGGKAGIISKRASKDQRKARGHESQGDRYKEGTRASSWSQMRSGHFMKSSSLIEFERVAMPRLKGRVYI